jgi:hypothetical protein
MTRRGGIHLALHPGANAVLDAWAARRAAAGASGSSVQWGAWGGGGMAADGVLSRLTRMGMGVLAPEEGLRALGAIMSDRPGPAALGPVTTVTPFHWYGQ